MIKILCDVVSASLKFLSQTDGQQQHLSIYPAVSLSISILESFRLILQNKHKIKKKLAWRCNIKWPKVWGVMSQSSNFYLILQKLQTSPVANWFVRSALELWTPFLAARNATSRVQHWAVSEVVSEEGQLLGISQNWTPWKGRKGMNHLCLIQTFHQPQIIQLNDFSVCWVAVASRNETMSDPIQHLNCYLI